MYQFVLVAVDSYYTSSNDIVTIIINQSPTANAGDDASYTVVHDHDPNTITHTVEMDAGGSSDDGELSYFWAQSGGDAVDITNADQQIASITAVAGTYSFDVTATDNLGFSDVDGVTVTINPEPNETPVVSAGDDKVYEVGHDGMPETNTLVADMLSSGSDADAIKIYSNQ